VKTEQEEANMYSSEANIFYKCIICDFT